MDPYFPANEPSATWISENAGDAFALRFAVVRPLFAAQSAWQRVEIVESVAFGRMLFHDGTVMLSEADEFIYHEMIAHVPLCAHPCPERVLVVGGGDGGTVRELLRHPTVRNVTLVEIDAVVIEACTAHLPWTRAALSDPRVTVVVSDGAHYVAESDAQFDVVLVDSSDPKGPAAPLFGESFYRNVQRLLRPGGILVAQAESVFYAPLEQRRLVQVLARLFAHVHVYNYPSLVYPGALWSFACALGEGRCPMTALSTERTTQVRGALRYYTEAIHRAAFVLPPFQRDILGPLPGPPTCAGR